MERWFTKRFRERAPQAMARMREMFVTTNQEGYVACVEAIRDMDHRPLLPKISVPTLVIAGRQDPATTLEAGEYIEQHIPGAKSPYSRPRTSQIWSNREPTCKPCWDFCRVNAASRIQSACPLICQ